MEALRLCRLNRHTRFGPAERLQNQPFTKLIDGVRDFARAGLRQASLAHPAGCNDRPALDSRNEGRPADLDTLLANGR